MTNNMQAECAAIIMRFSNAGVELKQKDVMERLEILVNKFKVPITEASKSVTNYFRIEHKLGYDTVKGRGGSAPEAQIGDISQAGDNEWYSLKAKIIDLWEPTSDKIFQTGIMGDETGTIKFTIFSKSGFTTPLEEGKVYHFENAVSSVWNNTTSLKFNRSTEITELDEDIEVTRQTETICGIITNIGRGSGLIKRCPECKRRLIKGQCGEHGKVDGFYDMRIKAVLECGTAQVYELIIGNEAVSELTGLTIEKAKEMATEAMDAEVVSEHLSNLVLGRYFTVEGSRLPNVFIVRKMIPIAQDTHISAAAQVLRKITAELESVLASGGE